VGPWTAGVFRSAPNFALAPDVVERLFGHLSPSSIDVLLSCPFAFYAKSLLKLEERPVARSLAWDAALAGTIGHEVLETLLKDRPDTALRPADVGPTLNRVLADSFPGLQAAAHRIRIDLLRRELETFVSRYAELAEAIEATGGHSEWRFRFELTLPGRARPVPVKGSIDRVLLRNGRPVAIDFKSGDVAKYRAQRAAGLGAQVAVYAWAIARAGLGEPAAFAYLTLGGRKVEVQAIQARGADLRGALEVDDPEPLEDFQARLQAALATQLAALDGGAIAPVTPERAAELEAVKAHPCRYCELELLCRSRVGASA
jgi:ATP-dependent helicase/DNAse subunit B